MPKVKKTSRTGTIDDDEPGSANKGKTNQKRKASTAGGEHQGAIACFKEFIFGLQKTGVQGLLAEFDDIKKQTQPIGATPRAAFDQHMEKNRYKDVFCVDESRVVLNWPLETDDYIHANWVDTVDGRKYICTQGPIERTLEDFWRMIWQTKSKAIIMLCNIVEQGKKKCEQYWPDNVGESMTYGQLTVTATQKDVYEQVMNITSIKITCGEESHEVEHIYWQNWPDRGVPTQLLACFKLMQRVRKSSPVTIHCSAGIGRTGTIVGLDMLYTRLVRGESATLKQTVMELRSRRHGSVQMDIQYLFVGRVVAEFVITRGVVKREEMSGFIGQYEAFCKQRGFM